MFHFSQLIRANTLDTKSKCNININTYFIACLHTYTWQQRPFLPRWCQIGSERNLSLSHSVTVTVWLCGLKAGCACSYRGRKSDWTNRSLPQGVMYWQTNIFHTHTYSLRDIIIFIKVCLWNSFFQSRALIKTINLTVLTVSAIHALLLTTLIYNFV